MNSTIPRDLTWQEIRAKLEGTRELIFGYLLAHGPATTTAISEGTGIGLLTVRPRVSELCAWGFAECVGRDHREGLYTAVPVSVAHARHDESRREAQLSLHL